jgi:NAD(P)H-hydrate epimerase
MKSLAEHLPYAVYSAAQVREIDRLAIERDGVPSYELMCRAGAAALRVLRQRWPAARTVHVYCGAGNNAGDGFVLARLAQAAGLTVRVVILVPTEKLRGDASRAATDCHAAGISFEPFDAAQGGVQFGAAQGVLVDALLGTGLARAVEGPFAAGVELLNRARLPVLALDVPSGLDADTGWPRGVAVRATVTVTFVGLKQGLFLGEGCEYTGDLEFADLDLPPTLAAAQSPPLERLGIEDLRRALPRRARTQHKGSSGRLLLVGGAPGMAGAIRLAAEAALRTGAGLVYVGTHPDNVATIMAGRPEIMCRGLGTVADLDALIALADAAVLGPGLGLSEWARPLWRRLLGAELPLIVDADALNLLAAEPLVRRHWLVTPHPGEAARLLGISSADIQRDRYGAVRELARRYGAVAVLKGACSLVASPEPPVPTWVCDRGNPGMATAGMGDVLSGVLGALVVQTGDLLEAARAGVLLHALAGDAAALAGERGTVASDLMPHRREWANPI